MKKSLSEVNNLTEAVKFEVSFDHAGLWRNVSPFDLTARVIVVSFEQKRNVSSGRQ